MEGRPDDAGEDVLIFWPEAEGSAVAVHCHACDLV